jgi:hypothetical protein
MIGKMKPRPSASMTRFNSALRKVLTVSHSDMQRILEQEQAEKAGKSKPGPKPAVS